jgi:ATP-dependent helicase YprA (DUF1998 family)
VIVETSAEDDGNGERFKKGGAEVIGEVDFSSALTTVHPKAIYLHQGQQYHVEHLDFDRRKAYVKPVNVDYYTDAIRYTQVRVLEIAEEERITGSAVPFSAPPANLSFRAERPDDLASPDEVRSGPAERNLSSIAPPSDTSRQDAVALRHGTASAVPHPGREKEGALAPEAAANLSFRAERPDDLTSTDEVRSSFAEGGRAGLQPRHEPDDMRRALAPGVTAGRSLGTDCDDAPRQDSVAFRQGTASAVPNPTNSSGVSTPEVRAAAGSASRAHGDVLVRSQVIGFKKIKFFTNENVGDGKLELPENEMHTTAFWITLDRELLEALPFALSDRQSGIFGLLYALESMAALLLMCDRRDLGTAVGERPPSAGIETEWQEFTGSIRDAAATREFFEPNLYIYDAYPGGIGFSEPLYRVHDLLLRRTRELIDACPCENGCPSCVGPAGEKSERTKEAALAILERLCS